jgi:hypothetical protein
MNYAFRLLDPYTGKLVAAARVNARSRSEAEDKGRRALAKFRPSRFFWEIERPPA